MGGKKGKTTKLFSVMKSTPVRKVNMTDKKMKSMVKK